MQWFKSSLLGKFVVFSSLIALLIAAIAFVLSYQNVALLSPSFLVVSLGLFLHGPDHAGRLFYVARQRTGG